MTGRPRLRRSRPQSAWPMEPSLTASGGTASRVLIVTTACCHGCIQAPLLDLLCCAWGRKQGVLPGCSSLGC